MDLLTRGNNETKSYLHEKMCGTPSSSSNCYPNKTIAAQKTWHLLTTVEVEDPGQQSSSTPMDYQEQMSETTANAQAKTEPETMGSIYYFGANNQLLNCTVNAACERSGQSLQELGTPMQDLHQQERDVIQGRSPCTSTLSHLPIGQGNCISYATQQGTPISGNSSYSLPPHNVSVSDNSQNSLAQILYLRSQRPRIQPHIRPKPSDVAVNVKDYPPAAPVPEAWCHAYYYELNQRIGEPFKGGTSHVIVDGFAHHLKQKGRGVRIFRQDEDVYAECLSEAPVFIQSPIHAVKSHDHPATVYRLPSGHIMQVFDNDSFETLLAQSTSQGFHAVYSLQRMCHMRISFVKGWGEQYKRQTITSTPCWVEIHLAIPLQKLDRILSQIPGPNDPIHSFT
ncbi:Mothers against decapentaplegic-like protein 2 [Dirofilaria immitis]|nr:Mothers against decapentaplegic-like protein 2 [Dirofilaria immitis]